MSNDVLFFDGVAYQKRNLERSDLKIGDPVYIGVFDSSIQLQMVVRGKVFDLDWNDDERPVRVMISSEVAESSALLAELFNMKEGGYVRWVYSDYPQDRVSSYGFAMIMERLCGVNEVFVQVNGRKFEIDYTPENVKILSDLVGENLTPALPEVSINGKMVDVSKISPELLEALQNLPEV